MTKKQKIENFDPNGVGQFNGQLYGLPFNYEESAVIIIPVPWEVTVSYSPGTAKAPEAILAASPQLDFYDPYIKNAWQQGIYLLPVSEHWAAQNETYRQQAAAYIHFLENGGSINTNPSMANLLAEINKQCANLTAFVEQQATKIIADGKIPAVLGGDHSSPLGLLRALAAKHTDFGILQIDAHADLRNAYEGFTYSHASIMHNVLTLPSVTKLIGVGIRDICQDEVDVIEQSNGRVIAYYDWHIKEVTQIAQTQTWAALCAEIVAQLPQKVYVSFDIDGLDPKLCPHTGTPVPGGLQWAAVMYLLRQVVQSGRQIIGFDLCEVSPSADGHDEWDANVGARVLFQLGIWAGI